MLEASNDAAAVNDNDFNDSIMSAADTYKKFPGHVRMDQKVYDHLLGGKWHQNLSIVSGKHNKKKIAKPKMFSGTATTIIKNLRNNLKKSNQTFS